MTKKWNQQRLQRFIDEKVEEGQSLEYKAAGALSKTSKDEIIKDVSAMANAAGGTIIYGIAEFKDDGQKHLPEKLSPIIRSDFSKEWLEQIINNIKPRIDGIVIHPVALNTGVNHVAYVVEIPQGATAHQASDLKYHRRYNFQILAMQDHEIRDVMGRKQNPIIELEFRCTAKIETYTNQFLPVSVQPPRMEEVWNLKVYARNTGGVYAQFVCCFLLIPKDLLQTDEASRPTTEQNGVEYCVFNFDNTIRDYVGGGSEYPKYGPSRYNPILPSLTCHFEDIRIRPFSEVGAFETLGIRWIAYADNAPPKNGEIRLADVPIEDERGIDEEKG